MLAALGLTAFLGLHAVLQEPPKKTPPPGSKESTAPKRSSDSDRDKVYYRVRVDLMNGEKVSGLVREGKTSERPEGMDFVLAPRDTGGAGLRIWYVFGTKSFVFFPHEMVKSVTVIRRLSDLEVKALDDQAEEEAQNLRAIREEKMRRLRDLQASQVEDRELIQKLRDLARLEDEASKRRERDARYRALLDRFPPEKGWAPEKLVEINDRMVTDVFPTHNEREFVKMFEEWRPAYEAWKRGEVEWPASRPAVREEDGTKGKTEGE